MQNCSQRHQVKLYCKWSVQVCVHMRVCVSMFVYEGEENSDVYVFVCACVYVHGSVCLV